ncbi:hypothetical protein VSP9026_02542 [Vibrio spartinae]|uniref:Uncharacterized protein n=1 Tax=Vibrio spartinae TaxID=1918945 RepID=A0A1N6M5U8_9VIBR|nr:hypothetical protein VSP9026_02542 [Vibrio spartinae]
MGFSLLKEKTNRQLREIYMMTEDGITLLYEFEHQIYNPHATIDAEG